MRHPFTTQPATIEDTTQIHELHLQSVREFCQDHYTG